MENLIYDLNYFINKFKNIPDNQWICGHLENKTEEKIMSCALGHCGVKYFEQAYLDNIEAFALVQLFNKYIFPEIKDDLNEQSWEIVANINDGNFDEVPAELSDIIDNLDTAKNRILCTLNWIKEQQKKVNKPQKVQYKVIYLDPKLKDKTLVFSN